jgi:5-methylcytosine-specific restriction endonuclease McrA
MLPCDEIREAPMQPEPIKLIRRKTGDWWQGERQHWCAYCGKKLDWDRNRPGQQQHATRDHVIPRSHGGSITIPSCTGCNKAKGGRSTAEFINSPYFAQNRGKRATEWSLRDLWLVMAMASVDLAHRCSDEWPGDG